METSAKLYSLNYSNVKTYLFALLFIAGNIALPQPTKDTAANVKLSNTLKILFLIINSS